MSKADFVVLLLKIFFIISTGWILKSHVFCFFVLVNLVMFISMHWRCNLNYKSWVIQLNKIEWGRYQPRLAFAGISESNPGSNRHRHAESRIASTGTHAPTHGRADIYQIQNGRGIHELRAQVALSRSREKASADGESWSVSYQCIDIEQWDLVQLESLNFTSVNRFSTLKSLFMLEMVTFLPWGRLDSNLTMIYVTLLKVALATTTNQTTSTKRTTTTTNQRLQWTKMGSNSWKKSWMLFSRWFFTLYVVCCINCLFTNVADV